MTTTNQTNAAKYEARARAALAAGFQNETRRKQDGIEMVSRAYSALRDDVQSVAWAAIQYQGPEATARHWDLGLPYELHNLRDKHTEYCVEVAPGTEPLITNIKALLQLRNEIKAAALLPAKIAKRDQVPQAGDKIQKRGHCQLCGREHAVDYAVAKHGYTVEMRGMGGYFKGGCSGHQYQPMEQDRTATDRAAAQVRKIAADSREAADRLETGKSFPATIKRGFGRSAQEVKFAEALPREQKAAIESAIHANRNHAAGLERFADQLQALATEFHGQPLRIVKV